MNPENVFEIARGIRQILTEKALRETLDPPRLRTGAAYSWERAAQLVLGAAERFLADNVPRNDYPHSDT